MRVEGVADGLAERSAADFLSLLVVLRKQIRNVEDRHRRIEAAEEGGGCHGALNGAQLHALGHFALRAELALRIDLELDLAVRAFLDQLGDLLEKDVARLLG